MNVILLTALIGLFLVSAAVVFFFYLRRAGEDSGPERDSLLPFDDEDFEQQQPHETHDHRGPIRHF